MALGSLDPARLIEQLARELSGQTLIDAPMTPERELVVVIPVYAEQVSRLQRLLDSVTMQDIDLNKVEVIMVVNNRPREDTDDWRTNYELNQAVLRLPLFRNRRGDESGIFTNAWARTIREKLAVYAIDNSSPGLWVPDSNVGRARQRGLAEAVLRFAKAGRNGLVVHTDADCWFDDPSFMFKLLWFFNEYPHIHAMGGQYTLELDIHDPEAEDVLSYLPNYKLYRLYRLLSRDIRNGRVGPIKPKTTLGRCIVNRAFEGIAVGGFPPVSYCEDFEFCESFPQNGLIFASGADYGLGVGSAMRLSDRTPAGRRDEMLTYGDPNSPIKVEDVLGNNGTVELTDDYLHRLSEAVRALPNGPERLAYVFLQSPLMRMRIVGN